MRPFAIMRTADQWVRAAHDGTAIDLRTGGVELDWTEPEPASVAAAGPLAGLAFDSACRLYRSIDGAGRVERVRWSPDGPAGAGVDLFAGVPPEAVGDFAPREPATALSRPRALAIDVDDRLAIAETGARSVLVLDLWSGQVLSRLALAATPLDLAAGSRWTWILLEGDAGIIRMQARGAALHRPLPRPAGIATTAVALRLACGPGDQLALLFADPAGADSGRVVTMRDAGGTLTPEDVLEVPRGSDLEFDGEGAIVVARTPGESFLRFARTDDGWLRGPSLTARGYDGHGIVRTPQGRIGYWCERGFRTATLARRRFVDAGSVTTFRLDSGTLHNEWGRVFLDACVPDGTRLQVRFATTDDDDARDAIERRPPANAVSVRVLRPDLSPPMPPAALAPADNGEPHPLHRRETGHELPWVRSPAGDRFETYEAPVTAPPGRYLWLTLDLYGATYASPRVRSLRAELQGHDHLRRLPRTFSREPAVASFLRRFLDLPDAVLDDLDGRSDQRAALLRPSGAPAEVLPWLAGFVGLVLDERWPEPVRRQLIGEAAWLMRMRGTVAGLRRFLRVALGDRRDVLIVERWRVRGLGGALLGDDTQTSTSVVGAGLRVGGAVGEPGESPLSGSAEDAFVTHAHRFTVVIGAELSADERDMVHDLLEVHRPAHTLFDVCTVGSGMRVGRGLHVGLLSMIGRTGGYQQLALGATTLGRDGVAGRPEPGTSVGTGRVGAETRVG